MDVLTIGAIITASGAITAAIISSVFVNRKLDKSLAVHDTESKAGKNSLSTEHTSLSKEHSDLRRDFTAKHTDLSHEIRTIREAQIEDMAGRKVRYDQLDNAQQLLVGSASTIGKFADEFTRLVAENKDLRTQVQQLKEEIILLRADLELEDDGPEFE